MALRCPCISVSVKSVGTPSLFVICFTVWNYTATEWFSSVPDTPCAASQRRTIRHHVLLFPATLTPSGPINLQHSTILQPQAVDNLAQYQHYDFTTYIQQLISHRNRMSLLISRAVAILLSRKPHADRIPRSQIMDKHCCGFPSKTVFVRRPTNTTPDSTAISVWHPQKETVI